MTITVLPARNEYTSGAAQTIFNYTFKIFANTDLSVYITPSGATANDSTDLITTYTVDPATIGDEDGGFITLDTGANAGDLVTIVSSVPKSRTTDYQVNGDFRPKTVNDDFDRVVQLTKQLCDGLSRTISFDSSQQGSSNLSLPPPEAALFMRWKTDLSGLENFDLDLNGTGITYNLADRRYAATFASVAAMVALTPIDGVAYVPVSGQLVWLASYGTSIPYANTQGGGGSLRVMTLVEYGLTPDEKGAAWTVGGFAFVRDFGNLANSKQWGIKSDDATDDSVSFLASLAKPLLLEKGTALVVGSVPAPTKTELSGVIDSKVRFSSITTTSKVDFDLSAGSIIIVGIDVEHDGPLAETAQLFGLYSSNLLIEGCDIDANNNAEYDTAVNAFNFNDNPVENIVLHKNSIHNVNRIMLRSNATTGTLKNFSFTYNHCFDLCEGGMQFNFPLGLASGIKVIGNYFDTFLDGGEQIFMGGASVKQAIFSHNHVEGVGNQAVHLEEDVIDVLVTDNILRPSGGDGVFLTDNNVGGVFKAPQRITISNNIMVNPGVQSRVGVRAPEDGTGIDSYEDLIATGNHIYNYDQGIALGYGTQLVTGNIINNCNVGIRATRADPGIEGNIIKNTTTGISISARGGLLGKNTFENVTTVAVTDNGERVSMVGFKVVKNEDIAVATGFVNVNVGIGAGSEMYGQARVNIFTATGQYQNRLSEIVWDGATFVDTELMRVGAGSITFVGFIDNAGSLAIRLNNTTGVAQTLKGISIDFDGMWTSTG